jgi:type II secretory pathway pseudopilin PulG
MKKNKNSKKGMILISVILVIVVVMIYLSSQTFLALYDQKNLQKEKKVQSAIFFAKAGLERAMLELYLDNDSWLDGEINGNVVVAPDVINPDTFVFLYNNQPLGDGSYTVEIDYLQKDPAGGSAPWDFYDKCVLLRSTGTASDGTQKILEQIALWYPIKNLTQGILYSSLQNAVDDAQDNDDIAVTMVKLAENIVIAPPAYKRYKIKGGYDSLFQVRSVSAYPTIIVGTINIGTNADVELGGITLE